MLSVACAVSFVSQTAAAGEDPYGFPRTVRKLTVRFGTEEDARGGGGGRRTAARAGPSRNLEFPAGREAALRDWPRGFEWNACGASRIVRQDVAGCGCAGRDG